MYVQDLIDFTTKLKDKIPNLVFDVIFDNDEMIIALNRKQLMEGKTADNEDVRPYYSEDSYFKSADAAKNYIVWKDKITPNPKRNPDAPNLYINGQFHGTFKLAIEGNDIIVTSDSKIAREVTQKFPNIFGLTDDNLIDFWNDKILEAIVKEFD